MNTTQFVEIARGFSSRAQLPRLIQILDKLFAPENQGMTPWRAEFQSLIFLARDQFAAAVRDKDSELVLKAFGIDAQFSPTVLSRLISSPATFNTTQDMMKQNINFAPFFEFYMTVKAFVNCMSALGSLVDAPRKVVPEGLSLLELEVLDIGGSFPFARIEKILSLSNSFYSEMARVFGADPEGDSIAYFDSGSSLFIGIKGDSRIITECKKFFLQVWEEIKYFKLKTGAKNLDLIDKSNDVICKIRDREKNKEITPEDATRLITLIQTNVLGLIDQGAAPRDVLPPSTIENRVLLANKMAPKLLPESALVVDSDTATPSP
jgi:hypothetical protein